MANQLSNQTKILQETLDPVNQALKVTVVSAVPSANAALETTQQLVKTAAQSIDTKTPALGQALAVSSVPVVLTAAQVASLTPLTTVASTQSGPWNVTNVTGTVSLPTGAATAANQTTTNASVSSIDTKTPALGQALATSSVPVVLTTAQITTLTPLATIAATQSGPWNITNVTGTVSLPTGAATSTNQTTTNVSLSSIDTKIPALGQALAAASVPVVLTSAQITTLTPQINALTDTQLRASAVPVSGTVTVNAGTNVNTSLLALDSTVAKDSSLSTLNASVNTLLKPASTLAAVTSITNTVVIKADTAGNQTNALKVDASATTQPVSAASLPLPTGASTSGLQTTGNSSLSSIDGKITAVNTGAVVVSSSVLPAGAATAAKQPALGTAGTPSTDVITVQGNASGIAIPVSGTVALSGTSAVNIASVAGLTVNTGYASPGTATIRVAAMVGVGTSAASQANALPTYLTDGGGAQLSFGSGTNNAQTLRVTLPTDQGALAVTNAPLTSLDTKAVQNALNFGAVAGGVRVTSIPGNVSGIADFGAGVSSAQTPRSVLANESSPKIGRAKADLARNDYASVAVTTATYTQLVASTAAAVNRLQIFDSSGSTLFLATGAAASEVNQFYIPPGGIDIDFAIAAGTRITIRAVDATASSGQIIINFLT